MSNLINVISSRKVTVHATPTYSFRIRLCNRDADTTFDHQVSDRSVTCGNCLRMIAKVHTEALELHKAFLLGVAQAEERAGRPGWRTFGLSGMSDTLLSDEILWARNGLTLFVDAEDLTAYARHLTSLRMEREWRRAAGEAELCRTDDHYDRFGEANEDVAGHVAAHLESAQSTRVANPAEAEHQAHKVNPRGLVTEIGLGSDLQLHARTVER